MENEKQYEEDVERADQLVDKFELSEDRDSKRLGDVDEAPSSRDVPFRVVRARGESEGEEARRDADLTPCGDLGITLGPALTPVRLGRSVTACRVVRR